MNLLLRRINSVSCLGIGLIISQVSYAESDLTIVHQLQQKFQQLSELNKKIEDKYSDRSDEVAEQQIAARDDTTNLEGYVKDVKLIDAQAKVTNESIADLPAPKPKYFDKQQTLPSIKLSYSEQVQFKIREVLTKLSTLTRLRSSYTTPYFYLSGEAKLALNQEDRKKQLEALKKTSLLKTDPCYRAFDQSMETHEINCEDAFYDRRPGPDLVIIRPGNRMNKLFAMTKYPVSQREFSVYCDLTGECEARSKKAKPVVKKDKKGNDSIGIDLADIASTVDDYNAYCAYTGKCPGVFSEEQERPATTMSYGEAKGFARWLTEQTGFTYRLPTDEEWMHAIFANQELKCSEMYAIAHRYHLDPNKGLANRWGVVNYLFSQVPEWVEAEGKKGIRGVQATKGMEQECSMALVQAQSEQVEQQAGFRLVREIY